MKTTKLIPVYGTRRKVTRFLWTPLTIWIRNEDRSATEVTRWLETATWEEEWSKGRTVDFWKKIRFLD